jgi:hypothetical protein
MERVLETLYRLIVFQRVSVFEEFYVRNKWNNSRFVIFYFDRPPFIPYIHICDSFVIKVTITETSSFRKAHSLSYIISMAIYGGESSMIGLPVEDLHKITNQILEYVKIADGIWGSIPQEPFESSQLSFLRSRLKVLDRKQVSVPKAEQTTPTHPAKQD